MKTRFDQWVKPAIEHNVPTKWNWVVQYPDNLQLGEKTDIGAFTYINAKNGIRIQDRVQIGSHCSIYSESTIDNKEGEVIIGKGAAIGSHSTVMPGVKIGENAIIGAHSFVNRDVPANTVCYGVPAKIIRTNEEKVGKVIPDISKEENKEKPDFGNWPNFDHPDIIDSVSRVLKSGQVNYWTGKVNGEFEEKWADYIGVNHAIALANGTLALEVALQGLGISEGDEVLVSPRTFTASISAIVLQGAKPVFVDVDLTSQNMDPSKILEGINETTKAIICVHLAGWPCEMDPIMEIARKHGLKVVEDCAQAHGAEYKGKRVGSIGDIGCWSFCQDKILSTGGEGGMITTNDEQLYKRIWSLKEHGKNFEVFKEKVGKIEVGNLYTSIGSNYRMTEMQAAIGICLLKRLDGWVETRRGHADKLISILQGLPGLELPVADGDYKHSYYKFYIRVKEAVRDRLIKRLQERGIPSSTGSHSQLYLEGAFKRFVPNGFYLENARNLANTTIMFPMHPYLSDQTVQYLGETVKEEYLALKLDENE